MIHAKNNAALKGNWTIYINTKKIAEIAFLYTEYPWMVFSISFYTDFAEYRDFFECEEKYKLIEDWKTWQIYADKIDNLDIYIEKEDGIYFIDIPMLRITDKKASIRGIISRK